MQKFYSLSKALAIVLLVLVASACRKKIDFTEGDRTEDGALDPNADSYKPWILVPTPGITDIKLIEQGFGGIYFTGVKSGTRRVYYFQGEESPSLIWFGNSASTVAGEYTALVFSASNMFMANDELPYAKVRAYSSPTSGTEYTFNLDGKQITGIESIGNDMYISGNFATFSSSPFPVSSYFDRVNRTTGYFSGMTGLDSPTEAQCYGQLGFFACGKNMNSGRSIANWDGSSWIPYASITERVTDIEFLGDTLLIAGNLPNGKAILQERNGFEIPFNELINTAPDEAQTNIKFLKYGQVIYAYGTVNFQNYDFFSVLKYQGGKWSYLGKLNEIPTDLTILDGYMYAATASGIKKIEI